MNNAVKRNLASTRFMCEAESFGKPPLSSGPSKDCYQRELAQNRTYHTDSTKIIIFLSWYQVLKYL